MGDAKILLRLAGSDEWTAIPSLSYLQEKELQQLVATSPEIVPLDEIRPEAPPFVVAIPEFGLPGSGSTDIILFSSEGDMAIIECKLAANDEIKRKVIGQILEYGAFVWGMSYEELDQRVNRIMQRSLQDLVKEKVDDPSEWDESRFRDGVARALKNGTFLLSIVVDEMNEELVRTIRFLNQCGSPRFSFTALETRRYKHSSGSEVLVPHLHGMPAASEAGTEPVPFEQAAAELPNQVYVVVTDLLKWAQEEADATAFGRGEVTPSFTPKFQKSSDGKKVSVFRVWAWANGKLEIPLNHLLNRVPRELVDEYLRALRDIDSLRGYLPKEPGLVKYPTMDISKVFVDQPVAVDRFKDAAKHLGGRIRSL